MEAAMDRISQLPELILHHILSFLPTKEAARTSALSKTWLSAWSTNPILDFDQTYFGVELLWFQEYPNTEEIIRKFTKFLQDTMIRYRKQKPRIKRLVLRMEEVDSSLLSLADEWVGLALKNRVEELDLSIRTGAYPRYALPQAIFTTSLLTDLKLSQCKMEHCEGWEKIRVANLHSLETLEVSTYEDQIVDISAPSLESFYCEKVRGNASCVRELCSIRTSRNLKELFLRHVIIADSFLEDLIHGFPFLEELCLLSCEGLKRFHISSCMLKHISVSSCAKLAEAKFDTPNLLSISYCENQINSLSLTSDQGQWEADIDITCDAKMRGRWFPNLRDFVKKLNQFELLPGIMSKSNWFVAPDLGTISPPEHQVRNLKLSMCTTSYDFLDAMLWCFLPRTLTFGWGRALNREFIKFLYDELMDRENRGCCISHPVKCWRHHLKDVNMESFDETEGEWRPLRLHSSSDAYTNPDAYTTIRFKLVCFNFPVKAHYFFVRGSSWEWRSSTRVALPRGVESSAVPPEFNPGA
ncbi:hypothetical protein RJ640_014708 [Escallonia rubra]|uniref:F-box domain-containing protein n=1 Tax=Escallonia rubra TaxID=112253 RepID=A0AA88UQ52_9ASTE|nr:hypothetical protein RJ640_014708 [Escallonia rubra]